MHKPKHCKTCNALFLPKGPAGLYCQGCKAPSKTKEYAREATFKSRIKYGQGEVGVGKGNSSKNRGATAPGYKNGWTAYMTIRRRLKVERGNKCERCAKDLTNATRWEWVCHHKDHDRTNPAEDNLEILCKRCHQVEHECWKAFEGATTIPKGSSPKQGEAPDLSTRG